MSGQGHKLGSYSGRTLECQAELSELYAVSSLNREKATFGEKLETWDTAEKQ